MTHALSLKLIRAGIDTQQEPVIYLHTESPVCRAEGFTARSRVQITTSSAQIIATLNIVSNSWVKENEVALSEVAWRLLKPKHGELAKFSHPKAIDSMSYVRGKLYGETLNTTQAEAIINDIHQGHYSDIQLAAYVTACAGHRLSIDETIAITQAMVKAGERLNWQKNLVLDKHCVGGLPGNRTTPIITAIMAAHDLTMPKTSSRAITSPAGTADTMECLANVNLNIAQMKSVVDSHGACLAWGGSMSLSPADDIIIQIERALNLDSEGQMVASVISKKVAAGSTHVLIDLPTGPSAKVRSLDDAKTLSHLLVKTGTELGIKVITHISDGNQPVGRGIGPALEAKDVLKVLRNEQDAPEDLFHRSVVLAGIMLEMAGISGEGQGEKLAAETIQNGAALTKFLAICNAQGSKISSFENEPEAKFQKNINALESGIISYINNRIIAQLASLAGAPKMKKAGLEIHVKLGDKVHKGDTLITLHSEAKGELDYALEFLNAHMDFIMIKPEVI